MNKILIVLRLSDKCNRECEYCHWHNGINYSLSDIKQSVLNITNYIKEINEDVEFEFYIHGGEPTVHPDFKEIIQYVQMFGEIELQTNFDYPKKIFNVLSYIKKLNLSFHYPSDIHYKIKNLNKINKDYPNLLNVMDLIYVPKFHDEIIILKKLFNLMKIKSEITYNFYESIQYQELINELDLTDIEVVKNEYFAGKHSHLNEVCDTSKYIILNGNGDIFRCSEQLTNHKSSGNILCVNFREILKNSNILGKFKCPFKICGYEYEYL